MRLFRCDTQGTSLLGDKKNFSNLSYSKMKRFDIDSIKDNNECDVLFIVGTRPEIIKIFPIARELHRRNIKFKIIFTGQHFHSSMVDIVNKLDNFGFYRKMVHIHGHYRNPIVKISELYNVIKSINPKIIMVQGDTDSTLAGAITCKKLELKNSILCHIEAGLRSFDMRMPEEINRIIVDHISDVLFCPTELNAKILCYERCKGDVYITGNTIIDTLKLCLKHLNDNNVNYNNYFVATIHRRENIKDRKLLEYIFRFLDTVAEHTSTKCILIRHPHTFDMINRFGIDIHKYTNIIVKDPSGYLEFVKLMKNSKFIITDSGGIQEEANFLEIPCITVRESTERIETVASGSNLIIRPSNIMININKCVNKATEFVEKDIKFDRYIYGKGDSSKLIVDILENYYLGDFIDI